MGLTDSTEIVNFTTYKQKIYGLTYSHGILRKGLHDSTWGKLSDPIDSLSKLPQEYPRIAVEYQGDLVVGWWAGGVYRLKDGDVWEPMNNGLGNSTSGGIGAQPDEIYALLNDRGHLYVGGAPPAPLGYNETIHKWVYPWGRHIADWWESDTVAQYAHGGSTVYGLERIEDTIFALGNVSVRKMAIADMEAGIEHETSNVKAYTEQCVWIDTRDSSLYINKEYPSIISAFYIECLDTTSTSDEK